jgi:hypothetical protein
MFTYFIKPQAILFSLALLLVGHTAAHAGQAEPVQTGRQIPSITPAQSQRLSRDLFIPNSEYFFTKGQDSFEREIQRLRQRNLSGNESILKIDPRVQRQKDQYSNPR